MDEGVLAVAPTRSEVMRLAGVPKSSDRGWRRERVRYGPGSEEIVFALCGEDDTESVFIEHGTGAATSGGWQEVLERWRELGSPVGVRMDELEVGEEELTRPPTNAMRAGSPAPRKGVVWPPSSPQLSARPAAPLPVRAGPSP
jgi:hypothetical protein